MWTAYSFGLTCTCIDDVTWTEKRNTGLWLSTHFRLGKATLRGRKEKRTGQLIYTMAKKESVSEYTVVLKIASTATVAIMLYVHLMHIRTVTKISFK